MKDKHNITGQRFCRLTAVEPLPIIGRKRKWLFRCDCGGQTITTASRVRTGHTKSCGCLVREVNRNMRLTHGESGAGGRQQTTRLYRIWRCMHDRCNRVNHAQFDRYGGRGIKIDLRWADYLEFKKWALAHGYRDDLTIDRRDNDKGYSPENCRWATRQEQNANRGGRFAKSRVIRMIETGVAP